MQIATEICERNIPKTNLDEQKLEQLFEAMNSRAPPSDRHVDVLNILYGTEERTASLDSDPESALTYLIFEQPNGHIYNFELYQVFTKLVHLDKRYSRMTLAVAAFSSWRFGHNLDNTVNYSHGLLQSCVVVTNYKPSLNIKKLAEAIFYDSKTPETLYYDLVIRAFEFKLSRGSVRLALLKFFDPFDTEYNRLRNICMGLFPALQYGETIENLFKECTDYKEFREKIMRTGAAPIFKKTSDMRVLLLKRILIPLFDIIINTPLSSWAATVLYSTVFNNFNGSIFEFNMFNSCGWVLQRLVKEEIFGIDRVLYNNYVSAIVKITNP